MPKVRRSLAIAKRSCDCCIILKSGKLVGDFLLVIIELFSLGAFILSQYTRLTDGQTGGRTDRQNLDSNTVRMLHSRTVKWWWNLWICIKYIYPCYSMNAFVMLLHSGKPDACMIALLLLLLQTILCGSFPIHTHSIHTHLTLSDRAFSIAAPRAWNNLLPHIIHIFSTDVFSKNLKSFLFSCAF